MTDYSLLHIKHKNGYYFTGSKLTQSGNLDTLIATLLAKHKEDLISLIGNPDIDPSEIEVILERDVYNEKPPYNRGRIVL